MLCYIAFFAFPCPLVGRSSYSVGFGLEWKCIGEASFGIANRDTAWQMHHDSYRTRLGL